MHNDIAIAAIMESRIVEDEDVEVRPEKVPTTCIDENVCLESCRKYCTTDAWLVIMDVVAAIRNNPVCYCGRCTRLISDDTQSCVSAAWDGFISSVLASSNHPRQSYMVL